MLGLGLSLGKSSFVGGFDADYQAVLDKASALGYTAPSKSQQSLQNTLVADLKAEGIWDKLDAFYLPANDGSEGFSTINWKDPDEYQLTKTGTVTWTSNDGFTGDGSTGFMDTQITMSVDTTNLSLTNREGSFGAYLTATKQSGTDPIMGTDQNTYSIRGGTNDKIFGISAGVSTTAVGLYAMMARPSGATDIEAFQYLNGTQVATATAVTGFDFTSKDMTLLSEGGTSVFSEDQIGMAFIGGNLVSKQSELYTIINTYMTAISS